MSALGLFFVIRLSIAARAGAFSRTRDASKPLTIALHRGDTGLRIRRYPCCDPLPEDAGSPLQWRLLDLSHAGQTLSAKHHPDAQHLGVLPGTIEHSRTPVLTQQLLSRSATLTGEKLIRHAALKLLCGPAPQSWTMLESLSL